MTLQLSGLRHNTTVAILVGTLFTALWVALTWRYGFDLADEGYYWYGAQRMVHGDMPMRDFMAYDIGRYAWTAGVMQLLGETGIVGARVGAALYQGFSVVIGVWLALRALDGKLTGRSKILFAFVVALILNLWVYPYYKVFDYGTSIIVVAMLVMMLTCRSAKRWFAAGVVLGLAAIIGRNHGVYGALAASMLLCFLIFKQRSAGSLLRPALAFMAGTLAGFSPTFVLCALVDGFAAGLIASIIDLIDSGATNIALPVPWPWTVDRAKIGWLLWAMGVMQGLGFIAIIVLPFMAICAVVRRPLEHFSASDALMLCASFAGLAYAHYAYSRADLIHLALAVAPLMLLVLVAGARYAGVALTSVVVLGVSVIMLTPEKPMLAKLILKKTLASISVNGSALYVFPGVDVRLREVEQVFTTLPHTRDNFLAIPDSPALYAIYEKRMPIWEIYSLSTRNAAFEAPELARLKEAAPEVVFLSDHALDSKPELRYSRTHPVLHQWITDNYRPPIGSMQPTSFQVFVK